MSGAPDDHGDKGDKNYTRPTNLRIAVWIGLAAVGLSLLVSGLIGIVSGGH
ncbi:hypothetical protein BH09ACT6_BH09ACT6_06160 [soil metagenome]